jgi:hypothetical protein
LAEIEFDAVEATLNVFADLAGDSIMFKFLMAMFLKN